MINYFKIVIIIINLYGHIYQINKNSYKWQKQQNYKNSNKIKTKNMYKNKNLKLLKMPKTQQITKINLH